jgi:hypothetical protein
MHKSRAECDGIEFVCDLSTLIPLSSAFKAVASRGNRRKHGIGQLPPLGRESSGLGYSAGADGEKNEREKMMMKEAVLIPREI